MAVGFLVIGKRLEGARIALSQALLAEVSALNRDAPALL